MFTHSGTLGEVYAFLVGYDKADRQNPDTDDDSASRTIAWLNPNARDSQKIVDELLA